MPQVVNGCGTWYYGKNRVHRIPMTCPNCGAYATLESYDTTKYVVFVFVPLIPVSKWRVLEKCPNCTQHKAIKLKDWEESKRQSSAEVTAELRENPHNPETVMKVMGVATAYQDESLFLQVAEKLARPMTDHADVQAMLGSSYAYFSRRDQAEEAYKASLAVKDDPQISEQLALQLLRQGRPEEAEQYLQHALHSNGPEHAGFVHLLAEGYLADGQTERGLQLLDEATAREPAIKADKQHQQLRKKAEKAKGTGRKIPSPLLTPAKKSGYEEGGVGARVAAWVGPAIAVVLLAFYLSAAWNYGRAREVHVVNGLTIPYTATIAGRQVDLQPLGRKTIEVPEGTLHVSASAEGKPIVDTDIAINTSFFLRPFLSRTYVINPDQTALLAWEAQYYAENAANAPDAEYELFVGEPVYEFKSLDYEFAPFPMQLKSSGSGSIKKTRVDVVDGNEVTDMDLVFLVPQLVDEDGYRDFLATKARFSPENEKWIMVLRTVMPVEEYLAFLTEGLAERPVHVQWHRAYQTVMETAHPEHDLAGEYAGYLAEDPTDSQLMYLTGRAHPDIDASIELYQRAIDAEPPSAFAANALAFQFMSEGKFEEALPLVDQAIAADPESMTFDALDRSVRLATGRYDELIDRLQSRNDTSLGGLMLTSQVVELLAYKGDLESARRRIEDYYQAESAGEESGFAETMRDAMLTSLTYTTGDAAEFLRRHAGDEEPTFDVAYVRGDLEVAAGLINAEESGLIEAATSHLAVSLKAHAAGDKTLADDQRQQGIELLAKGSTEERAFAAALAEDGSSEPDRLLRLPILPEYKRTLLAALGVRYPEDREQYFALARKLNFERSVPWIFLQELLE